MAHTRPHQATGQPYELYRGKTIAAADCLRVGGPESQAIVTTFSSAAPENGHVWTHQNGAVHYVPSTQIGPTGSVQFGTDEVVLDTTEGYAPSDLNQSWQVYQVDMDGTVHADWRDTLTRLDQLYTTISAPGNQTFTPEQVAPGAMIAVTSSGPGQTFTFPSAAAFGTYFGDAMRVGTSWRVSLANPTANTITLAGGTGTTMDVIEIQAKENMELVIQRTGANTWEVFAMAFSAAGSTEESTIAPGTPNTYAANANLAEEATKLETARLIAGQAFDGTASISIASTDLTDAADLVYETASQALTNKDLTSGTNTFPTLNQNTSGNAATSDFADAALVASVAYAPPSAGSLAATVPRAMATQAGHTTTTLTAGAVYLHAGQVVTGMRLFAGTAGTSIANRWGALYSPALALLRVTADHSGSTWTAGSFFSMTYASTYTVPTSGFYYAAFCETNAGTASQFWSAVTASSALLLVSPPAAWGQAGITDIASAPNPAVPAAITRTAYIELY